ncbi:MAG TPA: hypothetical protein VGM10_07670 [Actinocrinis sp.]|jgi:hypothetical protein
MIRKLRTAALLLTGPAALGLSLAASGPAAAAGRPDVQAPAVACVTATPIELNGFAFAPPEVTPGESSTADLITTNCTNTTLATTEIWTGQWLPAVSSGGLPAGCPVIDPLARSVTYAPGQELAENTTYLVPVGCQAAELAVTVRISTSAGASVLTATAYLKIDQITPGS